MTMEEISRGYNISRGTLRYYERVGMTPSVTRTSGEIRDYQEEDLRWVQLAICMRSTGLPVKVMTKYVKLYNEGDGTIPARLQLLSEQRETLLGQRRQIDETIDRLNYEIERYKVAIRTGVLSWGEDNCPAKKM